MAVPEKKIAEKKTINKKTTIFVSTASFIITIIGIFYFLKINGTEPSVSAILSVITGGFVAYIVLMVGGVIREFTLKGGTFEFSGKIQEELQNVKTEVKESNKEICGKINNLNQNIQTNFQLLSNNINNLISNISTSHSRSDSRIIQILGENKGKLEALSEEYGITPNKIEPEKKIPQEHLEKIDALINRVKVLEESVSSAIPTDINEIMRRANYYYYGKKYEKALDLYDIVLKEEPDNADAIFNKAYSLSQLGRNSESIQMYERCLQINHNSLEAKNNIGASYVKLEKYVEALKWFDKVLEINPTYQYSIRGKTEVLAKQKKFKESLEILNKYLETAPYDLDTLMQKASILNESGDFEESLKWYDKVLEINPKHAGALNGKANALMLKEVRLDEAESLVNRALQEDPKNSVANYNKACVLALTGKYEDSLEALKNAIKIDAMWAEKARTDKDFNKIRKDPRFQALIQ